MKKILKWLFHVWSIGMLIWIELLFIGTVICWFILEKSIIYTILLALPLGFNTHLLIREFKEE